MIIRKLSKKGVKAFERMSGFKTTGIVTITSPNKKVLDLLDSVICAKGTQQ